MSGAIGAEAASELRHELRTPINHIVGYAEMLREDAADASDDAAQLDRILAAARDGLVRINAALPATGVVGHDALSVLLTELKAPQSAITAATTTLLAGERDPQFRTDVERIAQAARRLTAVPTPSAPVPAKAGGATSAPIVIHAAPAPHGAGPTRAGRILIVDDVEENRTVLARRLTREGSDRR